MFGSHFTTELGLCIYIYKCVFSSLFIVKISEAHLEPGEILYVQPFSCTYIYINACRTDLTLTISCDCQSKRLSSGYPQTTTVFRLPTYYNRLQTTHRLQLSSGYPQTTPVCCPQCFTPSLKIKLRLGWSAPLSCQLSLSVVNWLAEGAGKIPGNGCIHKISTSMFCMASW